MNLAESLGRYYGQREEQRRSERMKKYHWALTMDRFVLP